MQQMLQDVTDISIHSLRMEGDSFLAALHRPAANFNPLPPYGGRPGAEFFRTPHNAFQSTPSVWRETR